MEWKEPKRDHPEDPEGFVRFHGACVGCTQQEEHNIDFCYDCQNFEAKWHKPSLSNAPPSESEVAREEVKNKRLFKKIWNPPFQWRVEKET